MAAVQLEIYTTKAGQKRWRARYKHPASGAWKRKVLDNVTDEATARAAAAKLEQELFLGTWFEGESKRSGEKLAKILERQLEQTTGNTSTAHDEARVRTILEILGPSKRAHDLSVDDVMRLRSALSRRKVRGGRVMAPATVKHHLRLLRSALDLAVHEGRLPRNPARAVKMPSVRNERTRLWSAEELDAVRAALRPEMRRILLVARYSGMRRSEVLGLQWSQVHLTSERPHVVLDKTKNGQRRTVPLRTEAARELAQIPSPRGRVFSVQPDSVSRAVDRAARKLGFEDLHFHDLRHTWATEHWILHRDLMRLMAEGGWRTAQMVARYVNLTDSDIFRARETLGLSD